ncbi:MAG: ATP-binding protein [Candidatus Ozemobacteraceae bacterium]
MKPINTNTSALRELLTLGALYVDKTRYLYPLLNQAAGKLYFLSRPRRFGKSLTISTFEEIFKGNKDLFKGLALYDLPYDWKPYPVIRIDLGSKQADSVEKLEKKLLEAIAENSNDRGITTSGCDAASHFLSLIHQLAATSGKVVVLIDEYDKPILGNIDNPQVGEILKVLKAFYSVVKSAEEHLRFAFLTGVSKFSKVSVFSDLNNLTDLTMDGRYAAVVGYTQEELEASFPEYIDRLAEKEAVSKPEVLAKIRKFYNGYRFSDEKITVYNPVSCGKLFDTHKFANYWFETGTPIMLITLMKNKQFDIEEEKLRFIDAEAFSAYEADRLDVLPLLFQTGYLTIVETERIGTMTSYRLDYPNIEVASSFTKLLLSSQTEKPLNQVSGALRNLLVSFSKNDLDGVFPTLRGLFAGINQDLHIPKEKYYQSLFVMVFRLLGVEIHAEVKTADGRIDAILQNHDTIYVLEFKLNGTAQEALDQIKTKGYAIPYRNSGKKIVIVGIEFNWQTRNIAEYIIEHIK